MEKYLTVQLFGKGGMRINCYKVKDRKEGMPHFQGDGIKVWVNEFKERPAPDPIDEEFI